jgi:predicted nucleotidyltransferase
LTENPVRVSAILNTVVDWAKSEMGIRGVALVGSHARGANRPDSDIDLVLLVDNPDRFRDRARVAEIDWSRAGVHVQKLSDEEYGAVWSRRLWLEPACELELSFAPFSWADVSPVDDGTRLVVSGSCRILYDPDGLLARLISAVNAAWQQWRSMCI